MNKNASLMLENTVKLMYELVPDLDLMLEEPSTNPELCDLASLLYEGTDVSYTMASDHGKYPTGRKLVRAILVLANKRSPEDAVEQILSDPDMAFVLYDIAASYNYKKSSKTAAKIMSRVLQKYKLGLVDGNIRTAVYTYCQTLALILFGKAPADREVYLDYLRVDYGVRKTGYCDWSIMGPIRKFWENFYPYDAVKTLFKRGIVIDPRTLPKLERVAEKDQMLLYIMQLPKLLTNVDNVDDLYEASCRQMELQLKTGTLSRRVKDWMSCFLFFMYYHMNEHRKAIDVALERKVRKAVRNPSRSLRGRNARVLLPSNHVAYQVTESLAAIGRLVSVTSDAGISMRRVNEKTLRLEDWLKLRAYLKVKLPNAKKHKNKERKEQEHYEVIGDYKEDSPG